MNCTMNIPAFQNCLLRSIHVLFIYKYGHKESRDTLGKPGKVTKRCSIVFIYWMLIFAVPKITKSHKLLTVLFRILEPRLIRYRYYS
jgi:hypothetical protein